MRLANLIVFGLILVLSSPAFADVKVDFSAYARSGIQVGSQGGKGENLNPEGGFAITNRLQETSYFELGANTHLEQDSRLVMTFGNGSDMPHYSGDWPGPAFAVRNFYFAMDKMPDNPSTSLWLGSRMYRGGDIYLFDMWPSDNQNMLGAGIAYGKSTKVEFAIGAKSDAAYSGPVTTLNSKSGQRYFLINKLEMPITADKKLKTNAEFHFIPKSSASYIVGASTTPINVPSSSGVLLSAQYPFWGTNTGFMRLGAGDVEAPKFELAQVAVQDYPGLTTRTGSKLAHVGLSNAMEFEPFNLGVMYAVIGQWSKPRDAAAASCITSSVRPMYYVTNRLHAGFELDGVHYFKQLTSNDIDYFEISPMLEYAINKNVYGSPKFRLIASQAFYAQNVTKYNESVKNAFNVGFGFEVWF